MANIEIFGTLVRNDDNTNRDKIVRGSQVEGGYFVCSAKPTSGTWQTGQLCYCTADSKFYQYDGSDWKERSMGGTKVTLNGDSSASTVSFYAPTSTGMNDYHLYWVNGQIGATASTYKTYTTNSSTKFCLAGWPHVDGVTSNDGNYILYQMGTSVYMQGGATGGLYANAFYAASDKRLKENIKDLDLNCLDLVNNINLREFSWKNDKENRPTVGVIAQELKQVLPEKYMHEFIGGEETENEYLSVNDSKLVYLLIGAIQEQQKEIEELKRKIA